MSYIKLTEKISSQTDNTWRLQVWVSETSDNIPGEIFLFQRYPIWHNQEYRDVLKGVCSYADLLNYSIDAPDGRSIYFRQYWVDLAFMTYDRLKEVQADIRTGVQQLVDDLVKTYQSAWIDESVGTINFNATLSTKNAGSDYSHLLKVTTSSPVLVVNTLSDGGVEFVAVASLIDMVALPSTATTESCWRTTEILLGFNNSSLAEQTKQKILEDLQTLDNSWSEHGLPADSSAEQTLENSDVSDVVFEF